MRAELGQRRVGAAAGPSLCMIRERAVQAALRRAARRSRRRGSTPARSRRSAMHRRPRRSRRRWNGRTRRRDARSSRPTPRSDPSRESTKRRSRERSAIVFSRGVVRVPGVFAVAEVESIASRPATSIADDDVAVAGQIGGVGGHATPSSRPARASSSSSTGWRPAAAGAAAVARRAEAVERARRQRRRPAAQRGLLGRAEDRGRRAAGAAAGIPDPERDAARTDVAGDRLGAIAVGQGACA